MKEIPLTWAFWFKSNLSHESSILAIQRLPKAQSLKPKTWEQTKLKWSGCTEGWTFLRNKLDPHCYLSVEVKTKVSRSQNLPWREEQQTAQGTSFTSGLQVVVKELHKPSVIPSAGVEAAPCWGEQVQEGSAVDSSLSLEPRQGQLEPGPCKGGTLSTHSVLKIIWERHFHGTAQHSCGWTSCTSSLQKYRAMHWGKCSLGKQKYLESKLEDAYHE